jgi:hypothetical protein
MGKAEEGEFLRAVSYGREYGWACVLTIPRAAHRGCLKPQIGLRFGQPVIFPLCVRL